VKEASYRHGWWPRQCAGARLIAGHPDQPPHDTAFVIQQTVFPTTLYVLTDYLAELAKTRPHMAIAVINEGVGAGEARLDAGVEAGMQR
jgi:hypothetical protein